MYFRTLLTQLLLSIYLKSTPTLVLFDSAKWCFLQGKRNYSTVKEKVLYINKMMCMNIHCILGQL